MTKAPVLPYLKNLLFAIRSLRLLMRIHRSYVAIGLSFGLAIAAVTLVEAFGYIFFLQGAVAAHPRAAPLFARLPAWCSRSSIGFYAVCSAVPMAIMWLKNSLQRAYSRFLARNELRIGNDLKRHLFDCLLRFDKIFFDHSHQSLRFRIFAACDQVAGLPPALINLFQLGLIQGVFLGVVFTLQPKVGVAAAVMGPIYFYLSSRVNRRSARTRALYRRSGNMIISQINNSLGRLRLVKAYGREEHETRRFRALARRQLRLRSLTGQIERSYKPVDTLFSTAMLIVIGIVSARKGTLADPAFLAESAIVLLLLKRFEIGSHAIARVFRESKDLFAAVRAVVDFLQQEPRHRLRDEGRSLAGPIESLELRGLSFAYGASAPVLRSVTVSARRGEVVAFKGETGSGKSTLMRLLARIYDVPAGSVLINGHDIRSYDLTGLRQSFFFVTQESVLLPATLPATLRENLAAVCEAAGTPAGEPRVWQALAKLGIEARVRALPQGLDTNVGDSRLKLSGGEIQKLVLAQALLADARVLVVDEGMSGLDVESEDRVMDALLESRAERITLLVSHRPTVWGRADRTFEIAGGQALANRPLAAAERERAHA